jgi:DNA-binding HxlR family transcriptional regulator
MGLIEWASANNRRRGLSIGLLSLVIISLLWSEIVVSFVKSISAMFSYRAVQLVVSASLLVVTAVYAYETMEQTEEMQRDREAQFRPIISPTVETMGINSFNFAIDNSGKGAAYNVEAEWWMEDEKDESVTWEIPLLSSGERRRFQLPTDGGYSSNDVKEKYGDDDILHFRACFEDGLGNTFTPGDGGAEEVIKLTDTMASREDSAEYLEQDEIRKIRKELEDIGKTIDRNPPLGSKAIEIRDKNNSIVLSLLEYLGPLTMGDLKDYSGFSWDELTQTVNRLENLGFVDYDADANIRSGETRSEIEIWYTGDDW